MKNKIKYKKPDKDVYDAEKCSRYFGDEFGQWAFPETTKKASEIWDKPSETLKFIFAKQKKKKNGNK